MDDLEIKFIQTQRQRTKSESFTSSKMIRKSVHQFSSIDNLEDLLTCPIHLGIIDEPRQLQCGHTFCMSCLENYVNHSSGPQSKHICCPLCRANTELDHRGLYNLTPSYIHKQLTEYLFVKKQKAKDISSEFDELRLSTNDNTNTVLHNKIQLVNELLMDIRNNEISLRDLSPDSNNNFICNLQSILDKHDLNKPPLQTRKRSKSVLIPSKNYWIDPLFDQKYQSFDQKIIRKNMKKYREYSLSKHASLQMPNPIIGTARVHCPISAKPADKTMDLVFIMKDSVCIFVTNCYGAIMHSFKVDIKAHHLQPSYIKCHGDKLLLSGTIQQRNVSYIVQLSLHGQREKLSPEFAGIFGGFCVDLTNGSVFVAYPSRNQVVLVDDSLQSILKIFEFGDLSPMFVAFSMKTREIWVSCPSDGRIAVYDKGTQNYLHLATNQIYDSTPTHIIETCDHRLLFLDVDKNRLFWIFRWNNCLYIQLLSVLGSMDDLKINTIESIEDNLILCSDGRKTFFAKPNRSPKDEHQKNKCVIL